jgi:hypothetical protein
MHVSASVGSKPFSCALPRRHGLKRTATGTVRLRLWWQRVPDTADATLLITACKLLTMHQVRPSCYRDASVRESFGLVRCEHFAGLISPHALL